MKFAFRQTGPQQTTKSILNQETFLWEVPSFSENNLKLVQFIRSIKVSISNAIAYFSILVLEYETLSQSLLK